MGLISKYGGFQWDEGNADKNWDGHRVSMDEIEQAFSNEPFVDYDDVGYLRSEKRRIVQAKIDVGRLLFIVYTERGDLVRPICARDAHKKERKYYEERTQADT